MIDITKLWNDTRKQVIINFIINEFIKNTTIEITKVSEYKYNYDMRRRRSLLSKILV